MGKIHLVGNVLGSTRLWDDKCAYGWTCNAVDNKKPNIVTMRFFLTETSKGRGKKCIALRSICTVEYSM